MMRLRHLLLILGSAALLPTPALAQLQSPAFRFLEAVEKRDGEAVTQFLDEGGSIIANSRDRGSGRGALHIVIDRRDGTWLGFMLQRGANPNQEDKDGLSPLMQAVQLSWVEGIDWLIQFKVDVDRTNRSGETALIRAVQLKNQEVVRALLRAGADPDRKDSVAGFSARDYAVRDGRSSTLVRLLDEEMRPKASAGTQGPGL